MKRWFRFTDGIRNAPRSDARTLAAFAVCALVLALGVAGGAVAAPHRAKPTPKAATPAPSPTPTPAPTPYGADVPPNVTLRAELTQQVTSATSAVGDRFGFKTRDAQKLGSVDVPAGTPGHGRVAAVTRADKDHRGAVTLQADSIDLPDGTPIWVNIDEKDPIRGHLADKHTHFYIVLVTSDYTGNMVIEPGTPFSVYTIARRAGPAPLVTAAPSAPPTSSGAPPAPIATTSPTPLPTSAPSAKAT